jgi:hypothetical protein
MITIYTCSLQVEVAMSPKTKATVAAVAQIDSPHGKSANCAHNSTGVRNLQEVNQTNFQRI